MLCFNYTVGFPRFATVLTWPLTSAGIADTQEKNSAQHQRVARARHAVSPRALRRPARHPAAPPRSERKKPCGLSPPPPGSTARHQANQRRDIAATSTQLYTPPARGLGPQSHFFSQSYETNLSTSLTVHSLYRPELVQLEDLLRLLVRRAPIRRAASPR